MNERIKELKHQAFLWCDENISEQYSHETGYGDAWEDKFAELIVEECIQSIEKTIDTNCDSDSEKMGCEFAITDLKEHFGVE